MGKQKQPHKRTNYQAFLVLGFSLIALGVTMIATYNQATGVALVAVGLGGKNQLSAEPPTTKLETVPDADALKPEDQRPEA